jgi:hypothetical protein
MNATEHGGCGGVDKKHDKNGGGMLNRVDSDCLDSFESRVKNKRDIFATMYWYFWST